MSTRKCKKAVVDNPDADATENEARQLHVDFNVQKCQLLVTARLGKLR